MNPLKDILVVNNLTVTFSKWGQSVFALKSISLVVPQGQWLFLVGHNGSGKSTLLSAISSRVSLTAGEIFINGKSVGDLNPAQIASSVFYVHQDPLLGTAPVLTMFENLLVADYQAKEDHESKYILKKKYIELLKPFGLGNRLNQPVKYLSGGERQLLTILIARLRPSMLILLDEPLKALDPQRAGLCMDQIALLHQDGKTLIQVTHEIESAYKYGNRIMSLKEGLIHSDEKNTPHEQVV